MRPGPPTLPAQSPDPAARARGLEAARQAYEYDRSYHGIAFVKDLPFAERFSVGYLARATEIAARLKANEVAARLRTAGSSGVGTFGHMFPLLPEPAAASRWTDDATFAWQRLAGPVPYVLARAERLPACLPVADEHVRRALKDDAATVSRLLTAGRLFVAEYPLFDGVTGGVTDGRQKYMWSPVSLYAADPGAPAGLVPVAIQTAGSRGDASTLYTPADPDWMLARTVAQIADENLQGVVVHMGWCHLVIQAFILAAHRQLSVDHPLMRLLLPHFEFTLDVNQVAKKSVVAPGAAQDRLLAPPIDVQMRLLTRSVASLDNASLDPVVDFNRRGVLDRDGLAHYPPRDDGLPIWDALKSLVGDYVRLYYTSDADVAGDAELRAFVAEVAGDGQLPNLVAGVGTSTVEDVVTLVSRVLYRATAYHATINDPNYDWAGYAPNMPTAGYGPLPGRGASADALAAMLPPEGIAFETISATYNVLELHVNRLTDCTIDDGGDPRVAPIVNAFRQRLAAIEEDTAARNATRPVPYPYLLPSRMTASINA